MLLRLFLCLLPSVFLGSCFLEQSKPTPSTESVTPIRGEVVLEDMLGLDVGAEIRAKFRVDDTQKGVLKGTNDNSLFLNRKASTQCEVLTNQNGRGIYRATSSYVSVGKLSFGPALQSSLREIDQVEDFSYQMRLDSDFPPGYYTVLAEGVPGVPAFQVLLAMPEQLKEATANHSEFDNSTVVIHKSAPLEMTWLKPSAENSDSIMVVEIFISQDSKKTLWRCLAAESDFVSDDLTRRWSIPMEEIIELPETSSALIYFSRVWVRDAKDKGLDLQLQGWRTYVGLAQIFD